MSSNLTTRQLTLSDAQSVEDCYDSQPKLMLIEKNEGDPPYSSIFNHLLNSGCIAFGTFDGDTLKAFAILWPWPTLPASTLVLIVNRPDGMTYNPERTGLRSALDAALKCMEMQGRTSVYFARSAARQWKNSTIKKRLGRLSEYHTIAAERILANRPSCFPDFNRFILGGRPVRGDAIIVHALAPQSGDF